MIIDLLLHAVDEARDAFARAGVTLEVRRSETPPKPGVWLEATSSRGFGQVVLWESGELDLTIADPTTGDVVLDEHREVTARVGVDAALQTIKEHLAEVVPD